MRYFILAPSSRDTHQEEIDMKAYELNEMIEAERAVARNARRYNNSAQYRESVIRIAKLEDMLKNLIESRA